MKIGASAQMKGRKLTGDDVEQNLQRDGLQILKGILLLGLRKMVNPLHRS